MNERQTTGRTTMDVWTFATDPALRGAELIGFSVEAIDGGIGKIDEATEETGRAHLIVDTGPWIFGKKVMLPAGVVDRVDLDSETVFVNRSKDEIKNAPEFEPERHRDDDEYRNRLGGYYGGGL
ncbi:MAG TPA: PRC-barrel domain-containing protein [Gaiellaceae bacterium]|nr:PRC-barrel domain-containing protein [Gaiellaceae bacterium]